MIDVLAFKRHIVDLALNGSLLNNSDSFQMVKFGKIASIYNGDSTNDEEKEKYSIPNPNSIPYIATKDISMNGEVDYYNGMNIPKENCPFKIAKSNSVLLCIEGGNAGKKIAIVDRDVCFVNKLCCFTTNEVINKYIYYYLLSNEFRNNFKGKMTGLIGGVSPKKIRELLIPIPSKEEQIRIVEKLDLIFNELNKVEKTQEKLSLLFDGLMNKVVGAAIQGKLVDQSSSESIDSYFEMIQKARQELIKQGKAKKYKEDKVDLNDVVFDIPSTWKWVYLGSLFNHNAGKALNSSDREGTVLEYITTSNVYADRFELDDLKKMPFKDSEIEKCTIRKGDLLVLEGGDIGRAAIWDKDYEMRIQNHIHKLRPFYELEVKFYYYLLNYYKNNQLINGNGIGLQGLSSNKLHYLVVPLPPLKEQKRIVKKIEEILSLCKQ